MEKEYIQVQELLTAYNVSISGLMERVKAGKLASYERSKPYEYTRVNSFDAYVDRYTAIQVKAAGKGHIIQFPRERFTPRGVVEASNHNRVAIEKMLDDKRNARLKFLEDRANAESEAISKLYVKSGDYENLSKNENIPSKGGRHKDKDRIEKTQRACQTVEMEYGVMLGNKLRQDVFNLVQAEMRYIEPHGPTFGQWYRDCPLTKGPGPRKGR